MKTTRLQICREVKVSVCVTEPESCSKWEPIIYGTDRNELGIFFPRGLTVY